jgi:crotonobetainyl-CoA:carnitine CoA-transferase CaiB-like acyl-CoA transferase
MSALDGIRVLDLSRILAGPWCSQILGDLGAQVIKIERPKIGDDTRLWGPPWMKNDLGEDTNQGAYYQSANRNKYSVAIDISTPDGQDLVKALAIDSDVFIENYKAGSLKKYGLDYNSLKEVNPRLIYCSITGFGQDGPRAEEPGYDFIIQGMGGLMSVTGEPDEVPGGGPMKTGVAFADMNTGLYSTIAIQAAIIDREKTGLGQYLDMALLDVQIATLANLGSNYLASGNIPQRYGNAHMNVVPYQVFRAKDQDFIIACGNENQYRSLCKVIGLPELAEDSRFLTNALRIKHRKELIDLMSEHFLIDNAKKWVDAIQSVKVPVGIINDLQQALEEPQVLARKMLVDMKHPLREDFKLIGSPIKMSRTPVQYKQVPPILGEHTDHILSSILSKDRLRVLKEKGVVG